MPESRWNAAPAIPLSIQDSCCREDYSNFSSALLIAAGPESGS